jgi:hypothetical protein
MSKESVVVLIMVHQRHVRKYECIKHTQRSLLSNLQLNDPSTKTYLPYHSMECPSIITAEYVKPVCTREFVRVYTQRNMNIIWLVY